MRRNACCKRVHSRDAKVRREIRWIPLWHPVHSVPPVVKVLGLSALSVVTFTRTISEISPTDPSLPRLPSAVQPLLPLTARCVPHLPDCAQPPHRLASPLPLPPHLPQANAHSGILSFPAAGAALSPVPARAASTSATLIAHPAGLQSDACVRRGRAVRPASADRAAAARTAPQSPDA